jgi:hypothetical protein
MREGAADRASRFLSRHRKIDNTERIIEIPFENAS